MGRLICWSPWRTTGPRPTVDSGFHATFGSDYPFGRLDRGELPNWVAGERGGSATVSWQDGRGRWRYHRHMLRHRYLCLGSALVIACGAACGNDASGTGGGGDGTGNSTPTGGGGTGNSTPTGGSAAGGGGSGGTTSSGGGGQGGAGGDGTGGNTGCPDINCSWSCPDATWPETDGCPSCACAAELEMRVTGDERPLEHVNATVEASEFLGGIDRWVFDFLWQYDDPNVADEAEDVITTVRIMRVAPAFEPTATNVTYFTPEDDGNPLEVLESQYTLYGFAIQTAELVPVDGFLSIRRVSDVFEGHVSLDFVVNGGGSPETVHVASPFSVPVP